MRNVRYALFLIVSLSCFASGFMAGTSTIVSVPFKYENVKADQEWVCQGGFFSYSLDVVTYSLAVTEVVREWEQINHGWYRPAGSFLAIVESDREPWQFWVPPQRETFHEIQKVPDDAPLGIVQFQQGAHSGAIWDEVFTIDVEVRDCP